jgi:hypothetical protein
MMILLAPFYILFGVLYLGGTIVGLLFGTVSFLTNEAMLLAGKFAAEGLARGLFHRSVR